jgi:hypothetical protein
MYSLLEIDADIDVAAASPADGCNFGTGDAIHAKTAVIPAIAIPALLEDAIAACAIVDAEANTVGCSIETNGGKASAGGGFRDREATSVPGFAVVAFLNEIQIGGLEVDSVWHSMVNALTYMKFYGHRLYLMLS